MNTLDIYTKAYSLLHNYPGIPYWMLTPFRKLVRFGANKMLPKYLSNSRKYNGCKKVDVIVSFTSFPARINTVWQVIECMIRQTYQPAKILLWLSKDQFPNVENIPKTLRVRESEVFEIRMVEGDIRSHKKYYYVAKEFPESLVFLIDDDIYYDSGILERTMKVHEKHPDAIVCNYGYHIGYAENGELLPYKRWQKEYKYSTSEDLFFGSGGGTLFKPIWMYEDLLNIELAMKLTPIADDIWLNAMTLIAEKRKVMLSNGLILPIAINENIRLTSKNVGEDMNNQQLEAIINYYGSLGKKTFV